MPGVLKACGTDLQALAQAYKEKTMRTNQGILRMVWKARTAGFFFLLLVGWISSPTNTAAQNFWQPANGPAGADVRALAITANGTVFTGTKGSGVFRSMVSPTAVLTRAFPDTTTTVDGPLLFFNLDDYFENGSGNLFYSATSSDSNKLFVQVQSTRNILKVTPLAVGSAEVVVAAIDFINELSVSDTFQVTVTNAVQPPAIAKIYWTDLNRSSISRANSDGTQNEALVTALPNNPIDLAIDFSAGKMYWCENFASVTPKIQRANLDGSNREAIIDLSSPLIVPSIALDVPNQKIYWTANPTFSGMGKTARRSPGVIVRASFDGSNIETINNTVEFPVGLAAGGGKVYWYDDATGLIERANLDGSSLETIIEQPSEQGSPLAVDISEGKIYWIADGYLRRANLDGANDEDLFDGAGYAYDLTLDTANRKVYWFSGPGDGVDGVIRRANLDGSHLETLPLVNLAAVFGLAVDGANRPPALKAGPVPDATLALGSAGLRLDLNTVFADPDGDGLKYSAASSSPGVVTAATDGPDLFVRPVSAGSAIITVIAQDRRGGADTTSFNVTVISDLFTRILEGDIVSDAGAIGCSWADYNNDGYGDLFVANQFGQNNHLYRNNGNGTFTKITEGAIVNDGGHSQSSSWGDYDNDGYLDLFVTNADSQRNFLYHNNGDGTFTKITQGAIVNDVASSIGSAWGDYDNDGFLDLFVANANDQNNFLYRNNRNGTFTKITTGNIVNDGGNSSGCNWVDYDGDGDPDLFVANRNQKNFLYRNTGNSTPAGVAFIKISSGAIVDEANVSIGGSWADYDNDGDLDLFVALGGPTNALYANDGRGNFAKIISGPVVQDGFVAESGSWGDYDNDGDLDLFVSNLFGGQDRLYRNDGGGNFTSITNSVVVNKPFLNSHGNAWGDYDNDGDLDLFVATATAGFTNLFYQNNGNSNSWINIRCIGTTSNASAIGAKVRVKAGINERPVWQMQEISSQTGAFSQNSLNAEFGLGEAAVIDSLRVEWPSGLVTIQTNVAANQFLTVTEENNPPVVANGIPDVTLVAVDSTSRLVIDLTNVFLDPDGDVLTFGASSLNPAVAKAEVGGSVLTVRPGISGTTRIIVTATDFFLATASDTFQVVTVSQGARPSVIGRIPDTTLVLGETFVRDLNAPPIFSDTTAGGLRYSAVSSNPNVATAQIRSGESILRVNSMSAGNTLVTVTTANRNNLTASTSFIVSVALSQPPVITHTLRGPVPLGQPVEIVAMITDDRDTTRAALPSDTLHYRKAGVRNFTAVPMQVDANDETLFRATIPDSVITSRGVEYFITAADHDSIPSKSRWPASLVSPAGFASLSVRTASPEGLVNPASQPAGNVPNAYRIISVPIAMDNPDARAILEDDLGQYDRKKWRVFEWLQPNQPSGAPQRAEPPDASITLKPGKGVWLITREGGTVDTGPGAGQSVPTHEPYAIPLHLEWNLIGNPFDFPIPIRNLRLNKQDVMDPDSLELIRFDGNWDFTAVTEIQPFEGYTIEIERSDTLYIDPIIYPVPRAITKPLTPAKSQDITWSIRILTQVQQALDLETVAGVSPISSREWDHMDRPEPPGVGEYVSVYFSHPEWERLSKKYRTDYRPESAGDEWDFEIETNLRDEVKLTFEDIDSVPAEYDVWLVDETLKISRDLRQNNTYSVAGRGAENHKQLTLVVSKRGDFDEKYAEYQVVPDAFALSQNFPNPFNPSTTIRYSLPKAERVTLKVYNLLGKEVVTLLDNEQKDAGYHVAIWNGRDAAGKGVGSGVYFVHMRAGNFVQTRKMVLVE
jgi:hypothetical protein